MAGQQRIVPTIVFHGDQDRTGNGDQVIAQARGLGLGDWRWGQQDGRPRAL